MPFANHDLDIKFNYLRGFFLKSITYQLSEEASSSSLLPPNKYALHFVVSSDYIVIPVKSFSVLFNDLDSIGLLLNDGHEMYEAR